MVAGSLAQQILSEIGVEIKAFVSSVGSVRLNKCYKSVDLSKIDDNIVRCPDSVIAKKMITEVEKTKKEGDTIGGEIIVPKIPSYRIIDIANAIGPNCDHNIIGIRQGEKLHEEMITQHDSPTTLDLGNQYVVCHDQRVMEEILSEGNGKPVPPGFAYCSESNSEFLSVDQIQELIRAHIDPDFTPV